jgi:hypothetical protein
MSAGDRPQGEGTRQDSQAKRQRYAVQADADVRKRGRQYRASTTSEYEPKRANELRGTLRKHGSTPLPHRRGPICREPADAGIRRSRRHHITVTRPLRAARGRDRVRANALNTKSGTAITHGLRLGLNSATHGWRGCPGAGTAHDAVGVRFMADGSPPTRSG